MNSAVGSENFPKTYSENKRYALFLGSSLMVGLAIKVVVEIGNIPVQFYFLLSYYFVLIAVIGLLIRIYPIAKLTIYTDHFEFQKGKFSLIARWSEVKYISLSVKDNATLFIETEHGTTKLIDTRILKIKEGGTSRPVSREEIIETLQSLSGKGMVFGDISLAKHKKLVVFLYIVIIVLFSFTLLMFSYEILSTTSLRKFLRTDQFLLKDHLKFVFQ